MWYEEEAVGFFNAVTIDLCVFHFTFQIISAVRSMQEPGTAIAMLGHEPIPY